MRSYQSHGMTVWICEDCMLHLANGEGDPDRPAYLPTVLSKLAGFQATPGLMKHEHEGDCTRKWQGTGEEEECECETRTFESSPCEGCGDRGAGSRHAATIWVTYSYNSP